MSFRLTWKKRGTVAVCVGMRSMTTGKLRGLSQNEVDEFTQEFEGKNQLEEPITASPFVPEEES